MLIYCIQCNEKIDWSSIFDTRLPATYHNGTADPRTVCRTCNLGKFLESAITRHVIVMVGASVVTSHGANRSSSAPETIENHDSHTVLSESSCRRTQPLCLIRKMETVSCMMVHACDQVPPK